MPIGSVFFQEANQDNEDAKIGANWMVNSQLTLRADVFRKDHQNRFVGANDIIGTASYGALYVTGYYADRRNGERHLQAAAHLVIHHPLRLAKRHDVGHRQLRHRRLGR